jgi:hypothetical protein
MHFASRLGLDQASTRGIPTRRDDDRPALLREIATLKARVAELELALTASATVPSSATASATPAEKIKTATNNISAKLKDEPWVEMGLSRRTYYRRKAAGLI